MNGQIYSVTYERLVGLIEKLALTEFDRDQIRRRTRLSENFVGMYEGQVVCLMGLIPASALSDRAYLWLYTFGTAEHKLIFARHAKRFIRRALLRYPHLVGHCVSETSFRWLQSLGAVFVGTSDGITTFEIS